MIVDFEKMMAEATPLPWINWDARVSTAYSSRDPSNDGDPLAIADCDMDTRIDYDTVASANAALIVAAVNALPELLARVKRLEEALATITNPATYSHSLPSCCQHTFDDTCELFSDIARAALNQETKP